MGVFNRAFELIIQGDSMLCEILYTTLRMSFASTMIAAGIGLPLGTLVGCHEFAGKKLLVRINSTLMGLPPVVAGLLVFLLLSRSGPLGSLRLLYTVKAMVCAQIVLITPVIAGMSYAVVSGSVDSFLETCQGLGFSRGRCLKLLLLEYRYQLLGVVLAGFGRSVAEVGAVQLVGGNILGKTRVMTTAIMLETNMGRFEYALALGTILLLISFAVNAVVYWFEEHTYDGF